MSLTGVRALLPALLLLGPPLAAAQAIAECPTSECGRTLQGTSTAPNQIWIDAAAIHQLKVEFVEALQRFIRAQAGTFGDEGAGLRLGIAGMREALVRWDAAIAQFHSRVARTASGADAQVAMATVLLDRYRIDDALRVLETALRQDDGHRADVYLLQALAYGTSGRSAEAARALRTAAAIDSANPITFYALARYLTKLEQPDDAARALQGVQRALRRQRAGSLGPTSAPFERIDLLRQAADAAPIFPQARYADGFAALRTGDYATAVAMLADAAVEDPLLRGDQDTRARVVQAAAALREGRLNVALDLLQNAVTATPNAAEAHRLLGLAYWIDGQHGKSIECLRTAIRLAPADERARLTLADVLADDRRLAEAERELEQARAAGARSGQISYRLAQLYERQSLLPQSVQAFHDSEGFGPVVGRDYFYRALGRVLVNQADFDGAVVAYTRRIEVNPNSAEAHRQLGEVYFLQGRDRESLAEFSVARWLDPTDARAYAAAGQVHVRLLEYGEAVAAFERALSLDPSLREARYALATSLRRLGRANEAQRELEIFQHQQADAEALGQRDFQLDALRREASALLLAGAHDQAIALFEQVSILDPQRARGHRDLGLALLRAKRPRDAVEHLGAAQRLEETADGFSYLADAYMAAGERDEAMRQRVRHQELVQRQKLDRIRELSR